MASHPVPVSISSRCPVKPSTYRPFFDWAFNDPTYRRFKESEVTPRLFRLIGGPGCGKTSFASLAVQDLSEHVSAHTNAQQPGLVISLFLMPSENNPRTAIESEQNGGPFIARFLAEIEKQIDVDLKLDPNLTPPATPQMQPPESILDSIRFKLRRFSRVFLVVDDLDCLWATPKELFLVEEQLELLHHDMGVRVLTTSRTPSRQFERGVVCDVGVDDEADDASVFEDDYEEVEHHEENDDRYNGLLSWWECDDPDHTKPEIICEKCYEAGSTCSLNHDATAYEHRVRSTMVLHIGNPQVHEFETLVIHRLQLEHGAFWPRSHSLFPSANQDTYPPLSALGKRLASSSPGPDEPSTEAKELLRTISLSSMRNVSIALAHIETVLSTENYDDMVSITDRMPPTVVSLFDKLVSSIIEERLGSKDPETRLRASLAIHTMQILAKAGFESVKFAGLSAKLTREEKLESKCGPHTFKRVLQGRDALEEILGASGGLLVSEEGQESVTIRCFNLNFYMYLSENYNRLLSRGGCRSSLPEH